MDISQQIQTSHDFNQSNFFKNQMTTLLKLALFCIAYLFPCYALATYSFEAATGGAYNFPMPLNIYQKGYPNINMTAHYDTKPFSPPPYYLLRIGKWNDNKAWELEFIHHKLYLSNTTDEVNNFTITNGYNLITLNRAWLNTRNYIWRVGAGIVLAHPESKIRDQTFSETGGIFNDDGYFVAGPSLMASLGKRFYLSKSFFIELEGKVTASYADVKIANGNAEAPDVAIHANVGIGYDL